MKKSQKHREWAQVSFGERAVPYAARFEDGYFGEEDPAAESRHVFCQGLALPEAWQRFFCDRATFRIVELGFGTGANFLQTARLWREWREEAKKKSGVPPPACLDYWAIEGYPLRLSDLQRFYRRRDIEGAEDLCRLWEGMAGSSQSRIEVLFAPALRLTLLLQDVEQAVRALPADIDGCYADGFAPRNNPAMWSEKIFSALASRMRARPSFPQLASFSVAKSVVTTIEACGFRAQKRKGLARKREVLQGFLRNP